MGPVLTVQLVVRIRENRDQGSEQCLVHRASPPGAERRSFMKDVNKALGTQQEKRRLQDGFMEECVWAEPGKMGRILTGCERRGNSKRKKNCEERQRPPAV